MNSDITIANNKKKNTETVSFYIADIVDQMASQYSGKGGQDGGQIKYSIIFYILLPFTIGIFSNM